MTLVQLQLLFSLLTKRTTCLSTVSVQFAYRKVYLVLESVILTPTHVSTFQILGGPGTIAGPIAKQLQGMKDGSLGLVVSLPHVQSLAGIETFVDNELFVSKVQLQTSSNVLPPFSVTLRHSQEKFLLTRGLVVLIMKFGRR